MDMSVNVQEIYDAALAIMDERDSSDYRRRTPALVSALMGRCFVRSEDYPGGGHSRWLPVSTMEDTVEGIDNSIALSAMPYGLAAQLYLQEDPVSARSWWDIFQENLALLSAARPARVEDIADVYGGIEHGRYGKW